MNVNAEIKKHKKELLEEFDILDVFTEENMLNNEEKKEDGLYSERTWKNLEYGGN